ncbi:putative fructokinase [Rosa chinensis]|uniref:Putative fructokinase n=1 Tax=Rosa chinensis TaxID=74649 RepID=A0A2P6PVK4_ROSCH|nr:putative fructokinase [Rosa chinensis]
MAAYGLSPYLIAANSLFNFFKFFNGIMRGYFLDCPPNKRLLVAGSNLCGFTPQVCPCQLNQLSLFYLLKPSAFKKAPSGAPANVGLGISRLRGSAGSIGKVGNDEFGKMLPLILKENNVNTSALRFDHKARTSLAFVTFRADGERKFLFFRNPSADLILHESELEISLLQQAKTFNYGSVRLIDESCRLTHLAAMNTAKKSGCILSYDPNLRLPLWPSAEAASKEIISEDEITVLAGGDDPYDDNMVLTKLFHPNLKLLIVTEGSEGCRYYNSSTSNFRGRFAGIKVKPVNTTGAGDAFVSGMLKSIASYLSLFQVPTSHAYVLKSKLCLIWHFIETNCLCIKYVAMSLAKCCFLFSPFFYLANCILGRKNFGRNLQLI